MKIAGIYYPISSVGGIATAAHTFRRAAALAGDTFDVLVCPNQRTKTPRLYDEEQLIRGGDTYIRVHGIVSHHPAQMQATAQFLLKNYDALFFIHPCCHPTKAYGDVPYWAAMYDIPMPKAMRICDGYFNTYEWAEEVMKKCEAVYVNQTAYGFPLEAKGIPYKLLQKPFLPFRNTEVKSLLEIERAKKRLTLFPNQWKNIKLPWQFVRALPLIKGDVDMYSNGIEYYQIRKDPIWEAAVDVDRFAARTGSGNFCPRGRKRYQEPRVSFHGYVTPEEMAKAYSRAWSMFDLMGQNAKYAAYQHGAYNNTAVEALWYGCRPLLHPQVLNGPLGEIKDIIEVMHLDDVKKNEEGQSKKIANHINTMRIMEQHERAAAREWVRKHHHGVEIWKRLKESLDVAC